MIYVKEKIKKGKTGLGAHITLPYGFKLNTCLTSPYIVYNKNKNFNSEKIRCFCDFHHNFI